MEQVACLVGDNAKVNVKLAMFLGVPFIGCYAHKFNLEQKRATDRALEFKAIVGKVCAEQVRMSCGRVLQQSHSSVNDKVHATVEKFKTPKNTAKLLQLTPLRVLGSNKTRWSSVYKTLERFASSYTEIRTVCQDPENDGNFKLLTKDELDALKDIHLPHLNEINFIMVQLQGKGFSLADCRLWMDSVLTLMNDDDTDDDENQSEREGPANPFDKGGPKMDGHYISTESSFMHAAVFESAVVKIQSGEARTLMPNERKAVKHLEAKKALAPPQLPASPARREQPLRL